MILLLLEVRGWSDVIKGSQGKECRRSLETSKGKENVISPRAVRSEQLCHHLDVRLALSV